MFCSKCGQEIRDEAVVCVHCGCAVENNRAAAEDKVSVGIIILTILIPIVGVIMGIVNLCRKLTRSGGIYLAVGIGAWIVKYLVLVVIGMM